MKTSRSKIRLSLSLAVLFAAAAVMAVTSINAGGPLAIVNGQPMRWSRSEVRGGPLDSTTVDPSGRVLYRVDSGRLGPIPEAQATALVDRIFKEYTDVPTATIEFVNAGRIRHPSTMEPVDVNGSNFGAFVSSTNPTFQNAIIFDSDGSITGGGGVLGFFRLLQVDEQSGSLDEGFVVLNGDVLNRGLSTPSFLGVFTHEFGHFAGPLDHAQINGLSADFGLTGFTSGQAFDLFAPFTETMYPFLFSAPAGSQLGGQFPESGFFIATLDMDTQNALSNLYPSDEYVSSRGSIEGRVLIRTESGDIPITGINVVARKFSPGGSFPPPIGTLAFPSAPTIDSDGVPSIPPDQLATDSLKFASSAVTGLEFGVGTYRIQGLLPGDYFLHIDRISSNAVGGSGIGPLAEQIPVPVVEFYNGGAESATDNPSDFVPVTVTAGNVTGNIDIILNGFSSAPVISFPEVEPNEHKKKAPRISLPALVTGDAAETDPSLLRMTLVAGLTDKIEDLYRFTASVQGTYFIFLESTSGSGDLDLYLFTSGVAKKKSSLSDPNLIGLSVSPTSTELIVVELLPGNHVIGISAFQGRQTYTVRVLPPG